MRLLLVVFRLYLVFMFLVLVPNASIISYGQQNQTTDEQDYVRMFRDIGIPLITLAATIGVGAFSAKYIVSS